MLTHLRATATAVRKASTFATFCVVSAAIVGSLFSWWPFLFRSKRSPFFCSISSGNPLLGCHEHLPCATAKLSHLQHLNLILDHSQRCPSYSRSRTSLSFMLPAPRPVSPRVDISACVHTYSRSRTFGPRSVRHSYLDFRLHTRGLRTEGGWG